jgi:hypothetical protein
MRKKLKVRGEKEKKEQISNYKNQINQNFQIQNGETEKRKNVETKNEGEKKWCLVLKFKG